MNLKFSDFKIVPVFDSIKRINLSDEEYFSSKYRDYISNSRLKNIDPEEGGSPEQYINPPHLSTQSLSIGGHIHELLLQPESFVLGPKLHKPTAKLGQVADYVYEHRSDNIPIEETIKEASVAIGYYVNQIDSKISYIIEKCQPYWDALDVPRWKNKGKSEILLSDRDHDIVAGCIKSCYDNTRLMEKLHPKDVFGDPIESYNEIAFFIDFIVTYKGKKCTTLRFKMKADNYTVDVDNKLITLNDLKTTSKPVAWFMNEEYGSMTHYCYYRQMYIYMMVLWLYCTKKYGASKETGWKTDANMLVVQTSPDYSSRCYNVGKSWMRRGKFQAEQLLKRVAAYQIFGWESELNFI